MLIKSKKCPNCETYYDPTLEKCPGCHKHNELYLDRQVSTNIAYMHPIAQIGLFLAGFAFAGMLIAELICSLFLDGIADAGLKQALYMTAVYSLMLIGLAAIVLTTRRNYFFSKYKRPLDYIYGLGFAITLVFAGSIIANFTSIFHTVADNANQEHAISFVKNYPLLAFFVMGFFGPICEELTYRVGLYSFLRRINKYLAIAVSSILFALIHFDFTAADIVNELWALPSYLVCGAILALSYEMRGPACSMTAHILYNIFAVLQIMVI